MNWQPEYDSFLKSNFGKHVVQALEDYAQNLIHEAQAKEDPNTAYALIKESGGVIKAIEHFKTGAALK